MKHKNLPIGLLVVIGLLLVGVAPLQAEPTGQKTFERWYVLMLSGQRTGYVHETTYKDGQQITSITQMNVSLKRGDVTIDIEQSLSFTESVDGKPIEATSTVNMGAMPMTQRIVFGDNGMEITGGQNATASRKLPSLKEAWLPPAAVQRHVEQQLAAGTKTISYRSVDVSMGVTPLQISSTVVGQENIEVMGKVVPATALDSTNSMMPGMVVREYVDRQGRSLKMQFNLLPGMEMQLLAADESLATSALDPPELMGASLIRPDKPIDRPRELRSAIYQLTIKSDQPVELPRGGSQRVVWANDNTASVVVDLDQPINPIDDLPTEANLAVSIILDHEDPKIRQLITQALGDAPAKLTDMEKADRLRNFVEQYIDEKDLSVGFATAGEVARTAQGDCTEHAVLLAAMLRAVEIPSRTVSGLIYVNEFIGQQNIFGYHMWAQAWLDGRWVDFDGVLPNSRFDAAHIALTVSNMNDATITNDMVALVPLLGTLEVKVVETKW